MNPPDNSPILLFQQWFEEEKRGSTAPLPGACCLSTIGTDGFPNARFVALKDVTDNGFVITGPISSRKGIEITGQDKVALTFWWPATEKQVRIQGIATAIDTRLADKYFSERSRDSQLVSVISKQGEILENVEALHEQYRILESNTAGKDIPRPANWGGYTIRPVRIEFMTFQSSRFHERVLFELADGAWTTMQLQP